MNNSASRDTARREWRPPPQSPASSRAARAPKRRTKICSKVCPTISNLSTRARPIPCSLRPTTISRCLRRRGSGVTQNPIKAIRGASRLTNELKRLVDVYKAAGKVSDFELSDSNSDTSRQIAQIRAFIDKKCSIITAVAGSSTGLNDAIEAAYKAGIPVVTISSSVTSPYAINVDSNYARWGYDMASAIKKALDGKGNVLMVEGIAGAPIVALERAGAEKAFKGSDIKEARSVNGNWTANVTKTAVLQALATTPQKIDAVWTTGSESRVVAEAFAEANRPQPLITGSISGDALGYWKAHPDGYRFEGQAVLPGWNSQALVPRRGASPRRTATQAGHAVDPNSCRASGRSRQMV